MKPCEKETKDAYCQGVIDALAHLDDKVDEAYKQGFEDGYSEGVGDASE